MLCILRVWEEYINWSSKVKQSFLKDIHSNNIIWTEKVIFRNICIGIYEGNNEK